VATTLSVLAEHAPAGPEWGARVASLALHTGLLALAVWSTQHPPLVPTVDRETPTIFYIPDRAPAAPPPPAAPALPPGTWRMPVPPAVTALTLPTLAPAPAPDWPTAPPDQLPGVPGVIAPPLPASPPVEGVVDARVVEELPLLLSHPAPRYPDLLRQAGIQGRVVVEVVIDTTGRAEREGLRIVATAHPLFAPEAAALVLGSRYRPARFGGRPVRVRIQVPIDFTLRR
jgi:periplasmic protein TonB